MARRSLGATAMTASGVVLLTIIFAPFVTAQSQAPLGVVPSPVALPDLEAVPSPMETAPEPTDNLLHAANRYDTRDGFDEGPPRIALRAVAAIDRSGDGGTVILRGDASEGNVKTFRWVQTRGPRVELDDPNAAVARFSGWQGPETLEFLLIVADDSRLDEAHITLVPDEANEPALQIQADAGDDVITTVGRQVTLNGIRSEPRQGVAYRWIQAGGPPVKLTIEDRYIYTFVPQEAGVYRFALVIAAGGVISHPDIVDVTVLAQDPIPNGSAQPTLSSGELARQALVQLNQGYTTATLLATNFDAIADRVSLYGSYAELADELSRRLDEIVPRDPAQRVAWNQHLFTPLTLRLIERLQPTGLDLRMAGSAEAPLSRSSRVVIEDELRAMAAGFRSLSRLR